MRKRIFLGVLITLVLLPVFVSARTLPDILGVWGVDGSDVIQLVPAEEVYMAKLNIDAIWKDEIGNWVEPTLEMKKREGLEIINKEQVDIASKFSVDVDLYYYLYEIPSGIKLYKLKWISAIRRGPSMRGFNKFMPEYEVNVVGVKPMEKQGLFQIIIPDLEVGVYLFKCSGIYYLFSIK